MNYPTKRDQMSPVQTRPVEPYPPGPDHFAPPQHRPQPTVMLSDQDRLSLSQLLTTMDNLINTIDAGRTISSDPQDAMADLVYNIPYRHMMEMATNLTKTEGAKQDTPEAQAALLFKWAVAHRDKEKTK